MMPATSVDRCRSTSVAAPAPDRAARLKGWSNISSELQARDRAVTETMARQLDVVEALAATARSASDARTSCLRWLAVDRQATSYLRHLASWAQTRVLRDRLSSIAGHRTALEAHRTRAGVELEAFDEEVRRRAGADLGVRVAIMGKGGAGKTMICATLARQLACRGRKVLAVDLDTNPGLSMSLGLGPSAPGLGPEALEEHAGASYGWRLAEGLSPVEAVERYSTVGPDGVRFLAVGKICSVDKTAAKRSVPAMTEVLLGFCAPDVDLVVDLEAGLTTPFERYHSFADTVVVVVGPAWKSALTARRLLPMVGERDTIVVANRVGDEPHHPGLAPRVRVPFDPCVVHAERQGRAPMDACPTSPAMRAVGTLGDVLLTKEETA